MDSKPKYLYRGIVIKYENLESFKFSGVDLKVPYEPIIDSNGRRTVIDGNEYGVYMTDNEQMAKDAYGNIHGGGTSINTKVKVGEPPEMIMIPDVGVIYRIDTEDLDIHKPWVSEQLRGHYNNGFEGDEWITEEVPSQNYKVIRIRIGRDLLHDAEDVEIKDIESAEIETKKIMEERRKRLEIFAQEISRIPESQRRLFLENEMKVLKEIFGKDGVRYVDQDSIDTTSASGAIKYLMALFYNRNREKIDFKTLGYIEKVKLKLAKETQPESIANLESVITSDIEQINTKRREFVDRKENEGEVPNTRGFDDRIDMMSEVLRQLKMKKERTKEGSTLFTQGQNGKVNMGKTAQGKDKVANVMTSENTLEELKKEQAEAERIYRGRMQMGVLASDPNGIQELAQTILERQQKIDSMEAKISPKEEVKNANKDYINKTEESEQPNKEMSLVNYHHNPVINWLQKMANKIEKTIEKLEQKRKDRGSRIPTEPKIARTRMEEYQDIVGTDFSHSTPKIQTTQTRKSWQLTPEQLIQFRAAEAKVAQNYRTEQTKEPIKDKSDNLIR